MILVACRLPQRSRWKRRRKGEGVGREGRIEEGWLSSKRRLTIGSAQLDIGRTNEITGRGPGPLVEKMDWSSPASLSFFFFSSRDTRDKTCVAAEAKSGLAPVAASTPGGAVKL